MEFKVSTKSQEDGVVLQLESLLDILMGRVVQEPKDDHVALASALCSFLQSRESLGPASIEQIMTIAFSTGYFYRVFLEKNNVEILGEESEEMVTNPNSESSSTKSDG